MLINSTDLKMDYRKRLSEILNMLGSYQILFTSGELKFSKHEDVAEKFFDSNIFLFVVISHELTSWSSFLIF